MQRCMKKPRNLAKSLNIGRTHLRCHADSIGRSHGMPARSEHGIIAFGAWKRTGELALAARRRPGINTHAEFAPRTIATSPTNRPEVREAPTISKAQGATTPVWNHGALKTVRRKLDQIANDIVGLVPARAVVW